MSRRKKSKSPHSTAFRLSSGEWLSSPRAYPRIHRLHIIRALLNHITESKTTGCWLWQGPTNANGYGVVSARGLIPGYRGRNIPVHRLSFAVFNQGGIPTGMTVDHNSEVCESRTCINPAHLRLLSLEDNGREAARRRHHGNNNNEESLTPF